MKIGYFCLFLACVLPIVATAIAKAGDRSFNNRRPREWLAKQEGYRARANAAQGNSWEALAVFGFALLSAYQRGAPTATIDQWLRNVRNTCCSSISHSYGIISRSNSIDI